MRCFECETNSEEWRVSCVSCGASLHAPRAKLYLDRAESEIAKSAYEQASAYLAKADLEILSLTPAQRQQYLFTARAFWLQGSVYYNKGDMDAAVTELLLAKRDLAQQSGGRALFADVLNKLGNVEYLQGRVDEAINYYQQASEVAQQIGAHGLAAKIISNLGNMLVGRKQIEQAIASFKAASEQAHLAEDAAGLAHAYRNLAWLHSLYGPYKLALEYADKAVAMSKKDLDPSASCLVMAEAGRVYLRYGNLARAEAYLRLAYNMTQQGISKVAQETVNLSMADLMRAKADYDAWLGYLNNVLNNSVSGPIYKFEASTQLIEYYVLRAEWDKAKRVIRQISSSEHITKFPEDSAFFSRAQARLHDAQGEWQLASQYYTEAIDSGIFSDFELANTLEGYGKMLLRQAAAAPNPDLLAQAALVLTQALELFSKLGLTQRCSKVSALIPPLSN